MRSPDSDSEGSTAVTQRGPAPPFPHLPPELVLRVLKRLPQKDLRVASQASRDFYSLALVAGLYIQRKVLWAPILQPIFEEALATLGQVVDHVATRPALNIAIFAAFSPSRETDLEAATQLFIASVRRALPFLVRLHRLGCTT
ncbi:hypothetical protein AURDEDRAFT_173484 [Auricularia subglabra TFB-10046 SS5]|nr:hypothetical protein AURDEDRAFT_173484 [Auricularia subglabra TFB-10046 SS5]